jgi:hypothetical protein
LARRLFVIKLKTWLLSGGGLPSATAAQTSLVMPGWKQTLKAEGLEVSVAAFGLFSLGWMNWAGRPAAQ